MALSEEKKKKKPQMMLKDYLKQEQGSEFPTTHYGWWCQETTVRTLLQFELGDGRRKPTKSGKSKSKVASLTRFSAFLNAVKMLASVSSVPKSGQLQRSFSRRKMLPTPFWRKRCSSTTSNSFQTGAFLIRDAMRVESFGDESRGGKAVFSPPLPPSPVCSSTSGWSELDSCSGSDSVASFPSPIIQPDVLTDSNKIAEKKEDEAEDGPTCHDYEEKEQLSPVSVMDFPYEDAAAASSEESPSFVRIERTKQELLKKIRRFESLAHVVDPLDLEEAFSEEEEEDMDGQDEVEEEEDAMVNARGLLERVRKWSSAGALDEMLLLDFFVEGLLQETDPTVEERLLRTVKDWTDGIVRRDVASGEALISEMDGFGRRRSVHEVDVELAAELERKVLASLVDEFLLELLFDY